MKQFPGPMESSYPRHFDSLTCDSSMSLRLRPSSTTDIWMRCIMTMANPEKLFRKPPGILNSISRLSYFTLLANSPSTVHEINWKDIFFTSWPALSIFENKTARDWTMTQLIWIDLNRWHLILPRYSINNLAIQFWMCCASQKISLSWRPQGSCGAATAACRGRPLSVQPRPAMGHR